MKIYFFIVTILLVIIGDQLTKASILSHFQYGESIVMIQDFFNLTYVRNLGAAFGFLAGSDASFRIPFFVVVPIIALVVLVYLYVDLPPAAKWRATALGMVSGGALGNLIDRARLGYVVDFLDFHYKNAYSFPAFNVADSAICVGVGILLLSTLQLKEKPNASHSA